MRLAQEFGEQQPYSTYVYEPLYGKYTDEQLSGTDPANGNGVQFSLVPSSFDPNFYGTADAQQAKLAETQVANPFVKLPSVLEDVMHWQTLRESGDSLSDGAVFDRTAIRHFDLEPERIGYWLYVPSSYVYDVGKPLLRNSSAVYGSLARVAVG